LRVPEQKRAGLPVGWLVAFLGRRRQGDGLDAAGEAHEVSQRLDLEREEAIEGCRTLIKEALERMLRSGIRLDQGIESYLAASMREWVGDRLERFADRTEQGFHALCGFLDGGIDDGVFGMVGAVCHQQLERCKLPTEFDQGRHGVGRG
jgi:hypothetical protein